MNKTIRRWAFRSKNQLPLFLIWEEDWEFGEVVYAREIFAIRLYWTDPRWWRA